MRAGAQGAAPGGFVAGQFDPAFRTAPAAASVVLHQAVAHRPFGGQLVLAVHGGHHLVAAVDGALAVAAHHLDTDHLGQVRRVQFGRLSVRRGGVRLRLGLAHLLGGDEAFLLHALQDVVPADHGARRIADRIAGGREFRDAGQGRRLGQAQLVQLLAVVIVGRRHDAVGAVAEEDLVQVQLEDLVLAELALHLQRQQHFLELAEIAVLVAEEEVARDLLGDGAAAGHALVAGGGGQPDRARDAAPVQADVLVEVRVLDGDHGVAGLDRDIPDGDGVTAVLAELGDELAVAAVHGHRHLPFDPFELRHIRQGRGYGEVGDGQHQRQPGRAQDRQTDQPFD